MKKWKKFLISLITVFVLAILPAESAILPGTVCVTEAAPRISSSKLTMIKGQSRTLKITGLKKGQKATWKSSSPKLVTVSASGKLSAIRNESSNLSFHFQKLTDPYEILTQKDASELANDTLDMAVPYWTDLLKGSGITLRSWAFQLQNKLFPKTDRAYPATPLAVTARGVVLSAASQPIPLILPNSFLIRASCLSAQQPARNSGLLPQHASASLPERSPSSVLFGSWIPDPF